MFLYQPGTHAHTAFGRNPNVKRIPHARVTDPPTPPHALRRIGVAAMLLWLAACSTPPRPAPDPQGPLPVAAGWSTPGTTPTAPSSPTPSPATPVQASVALAERWWQAWQDPLLDQWVDEALRANPGLAVARATLSRSRALRDSAAAGLAPQLGSAANASRSRSSGRASNSLSATLDASWEPDLSGAGAAAVAAADAQARSAAASLAATRLALAGDVVQAYLQWQGLRERSRLAGDNLAAQRQSLQLARWRAAAGLATQVEVAQAEGSVAQTEAALASLATSQAQTGHQLAVLLGQPPTALATRLATAGAAPRPTGLPATGLPADLLRRRPDVVAAEHDIAAALATLAQREAERRPQFSISGRLGLQAASLAALSGGSAVLAALGIGVSWPVLDGGAARAQVEAQAAALAGAQASYRSAVLTAQQDVEDTLAALAQGRERQASLQRAAASAHEVLRLAQLQYQAGLSDFSALLDAQRTALNADDALASADTDLALNHVRLAKALGGGWQPAADIAP